MTMTKITDVKARMLQGGWRDGRISYNDGRALLTYTIADSRGYAVPQTIAVDPESVCLQSPYTDHEGSRLYEHDILDMGEGFMGELLYSRHLGTWMVAVGGLALAAGGLDMSATAYRGNVFTRPQDLE